MARVKEWIIEKLELLGGLWPHRLPCGMTEFNAYCVSLFRIYGFPNNESFRQAIATMIMHLGPTVDRKAPYFFAKALRKTMANQVAYTAIEEIRSAKKNEAKSLPEVASDEPVQNAEIQTTPQAMEPQA
jgi:hypothetical protein